MAWMSTKEAALHSGRHQETVRDALRTGELQGVQPAKGSDWRTKEEWVDNWVMAPRKKAPKAAA